jgi:hypothetical protein
MSDPLNYREPGVDRPSSAENHRARSTCGIGVTVLFVSVVIACAPLLLPLGNDSKYVIVTAFIGAAIGFSIALNGAIDWLRGGK